MTDTTQRLLMRDNGCFCVIHGEAPHQLECVECSRSRVAEIVRLRNKLNENSQNFQIECQNVEIERLRHDLARAVENHTRDLGELERLRGRLAEAMSLLEYASLQGADCVFMERYRDIAGTSADQPTEGEK